MKQQYNYHCFHFLLFGTSRLRRRNHGCRAHSPFVVAVGSRAFGVNLIVSWDLGLGVQASLLRLGFRLWFPGSTSLVSLVSNLSGTARAKFSKLSGQIPFGCTNKCWHPCIICEQHGPPKTQNLACWSSFAPSLWPGRSCCWHAGLLWPAKCAMMCWFLKVIWKNSVWHSNESRVKTIQKLSGIIGALNHQSSFPACWPAHLCRVQTPVASCDRTSGFHFCIT